MTKPRKPSGKGQKVWEKIAPYLRYDIRNRDHAYYRALGDWMTWNFPTYRDFASNELEELFHLKDIKRVATVMAKDPLVLRDYVLYEAHHRLWRFIDEKFSYYSIEPIEIKGVPHLLRFWDGHPIVVPLIDALEWISSYGEREPRDCREFQEWDSLPLPGFL